MKPYTTRLSAVLLALTPFAALSCKKESANSAAPPAADGSAAAAPSGPAPAVDASQWGFVARLPKSTEGFMAFYNAGPLTESLLASKWFAKLKANKEFGPQLQQALSNLQTDPQAKEILALVNEIAGKEMVFSFGEGTVENFSKLGPVVIPIFRQAVKASAEGKMQPQPVPGSPGTVMQMSLWQMLIQNETPESKSAMFEVLGSLEAPPLLAAVKAGGAKEKLNGLIAKALASMPPEAGKVLERGTFKAGGEFEFQSLTFKVANIPVTPEKAAAEEAHFTKMLGSEAKAKALLAKVKAKTIELSWGWAGDYLVVSLGKDHSHVQLATGGESVLSLREVAPHAGAWQAKKPFVFSYLSQSTSRALNGGSIFSLAAELLESGAGQSPVPVAPIVNALKKLAGRSAELWPNDADAITTAAWWDGGLQAESFGGPKPHAFDSSKPLTFPALAGPATFLALASRVSEADNTKTFGFFEEVCSTLWDAYQTGIKPSLPKEIAAQTGMAEALGIPMVKGLWKGVQDFRTALGTQSLLMVNLDGDMPPLPNVPPAFKGQKIPRLLYVSELNDRAKLSTAWKGFGDVIGSILALSKAPVSPKPTEKKDGDLTSWGWTLPVDLGDMWPHVAASGDRWYFSTSTSLTKTAAAAAPAPSGPAASMMVHINFSLLWNYAGTLMKASPQNSETAAAILDLYSAVTELTATSGESDGAAHTKLHLRIVDGN